jgi:hypothetical protein
MKIRFPVPSFRQATPNEFVRFWHPFFPDSNYPERFYSAHIGQPLTDKRVKAWFRWKNRIPLSPRKLDTIRQYFVPKIERVGHNADSETLTAFLNRPGGAIWRIFWLHLQHPSRFPIYDQHVHRAMAFLLDWDKDNQEIPKRDPAKIQMYLKEYRPFLGNFEECDRRQTDRALWTFGQFLKIYRGALS